MKLLSIGDIHGRDAWKFMTHGSPYEYDLWRTSVDAGSPADNYEFWKEQPYVQYDRIIFVGDYVDSFDVSNVEMKRNLLDIIHFRKALGDKVVLLLGNHDIQYIVPNQICSGYRPEMRIDFGQIFGDDIELFKFAHEETGSDGSQWLWTHAGVTSEWYNNSFMRNLLNPKYRFIDIVKGFDVENKSVAEILNFAWDLKLGCLFDADSQSGGISQWAGPTWVRPAILNKYPLDRWNQIVGHTHRNVIETVEFKNFNHYFIDCLGESIEGLILEI